MSTAAHEPRRVGQRRSESPSGSKVIPRRNAPETSEQTGAQYDSDELPVLIRLPNLRDLGSVETRTASSSQKKRHRIDSPSASKQRTTKHETSKVNKTSFQQKAVDNKLVLGGIFGGILVVAMLFVFNAGGPTPPADQDGWAKQDSDVNVEEPELSLSAANDPPPLTAPPAFTYEAPAAPNTPIASVESEKEKASLGAPYLGEPLAPREAEALALPSKQPSVTGWPPEESMGVSSPVAPTDLWPGESLSLEQGGSEYPPLDSPSQGGYRSSMYPPGADTYRMGKLDSDRPHTEQGGRSSILDGNIAIPDTKSFR